MKGKALVERVRRYTTVGVICAVIQNLIMIGSAYGGLHYFPATLVSVAIIAPVGYVLHCSFTFSRSRSFQGFVRFASGFILAYPFYLALMALFCSGFRWPVAIAAPLATIILFLFNYVWAHWAITRRLSLIGDADPQTQRDNGLQTRG